jgi:hypothetical protein
MTPQTALPSAPKDVGTANASDTQPLPSPGHQAPLQTPPPWQKGDYKPVLHESWAEELQGWGIAPLVASARGFSSLDVGNPTAEVKRLGVSLTTTQGKRLRQHLTSGVEALEMPWYSTQDVQKLVSAESCPTVSVNEIRLSRPGTPFDAEASCHEVLGKSGTPTGMHPATPPVWIDTAPRILIAVGMLNSDALLTHYLQSEGVSDDDLRGASSIDPRTQLRAMMESISPEKRLLIMAVASMNGAAASFSRVQGIDLRNREALIVMSANAVKDPFAYRNLSELHRQLTLKLGMSVQFLTLGEESDEHGDAQTIVAEHLGSGSTLEDLMSSMSPDLPEPAERDKDLSPGDWRIHSSGTFTEECVASAAGPGGSTVGYTWMPVLSLGGRVLSLETRRQPTDLEIRTGQVDPGVRAAAANDRQVTIEISWSDERGVHAARVTGPANILGYAPHEWDRQGATIPDNLLLHPAWPPSWKQGSKWLTAVKANTQGKALRQTRWMQMGWVPTKAGEPVFIIGVQVVGDASAAENSVSGIDETNLSVVSHFGVGDAPADWDNEGYREQVRQDFLDVIDAYIDGKAWTDVSTAAVVLAGALRPTLPLRPRNTIYIWGPKGKGKTWTAQTMMYFWARNLADWQDRLPGGAKDTFAFLETVVSQAPIWAVDDLAPSASRRQAEDETTRLEDLTRAIFNNSAKGRMNPDISSKRVNKPIAQLIITAENELKTPSAKERLIPVRLAEGKLNPDREPTDRISTMASQEGTQARFTAHLLHFVLRLGKSTDGGWGAFTSGLEADRAALQKGARSLMDSLGALPSAAQRASSLAVTS